MYTMQAGTGISTQWGFFYDPKRDILSLNFNSIFDVYGDLVAYRSDIYEITVRNIFDKSAYHRTFSSFSEPLAPVAADLFCGVEFSPDGKNVIIGVRPFSSVFDVESGEELLRLEEPIAHFFPVGQKIAAAGDNAVRIVDAESGKELRKLKGEFEGFTSNGTKIITNNDGSVRIYDAESGKVLRTLAGYFNNLSPDGKKVVTTREKHIWNHHRVWDVESGKVLRTQEGKESVSRFSPDGKKMIVNDGGSTVWIVSFE